MARKGRTLALKGIEEHKSIKELDDAAEHLYEVRRDRMALTRKEVEAAAKVIELMGENKLESYKVAEGTPEELEVEIKPTKMKAKVRKVNDEDDSEGEE